ncbi:hypothetical protein E1295_29325 [Nonomuraea mesophila]|uniref:Uncharacterized protein n=1 Tax=Nonomuraea mesophila TaxID=2530382 RepID=A0A4R5F2F9_9ACTN|nr:hypothetical protein E1295_29325 [Nonomuraea mesophila]
MFADRGGQDPGDRLGELADLHEVLAALTVTLGFSDEKVHAAAHHKRMKRGGFTLRLWLEEATSVEDTTPI